MMSHTWGEWQDGMRFLKDDMLERRYREHGPAYFGRLVRRSRVMTAAEVMDLVEPIVEHGELSALEADEVALTDLVIRGRRREDDAEIYLVLEVSWGVGPYDVERAAHRAELLRRTGVMAMPVAAGKAILPEAASRARELQVWQLTGLFRTFGEGYLNVPVFRAVRRLNHFSVISPLNRLKSRGPIKQHHQKCGRATNGWPGGDAGIIMRLMA
jgi:hypothetical protein